MSKPHVGTSRFLTATCATTDTKSEPTDVQEKSGIESGLAHSQDPKGELNGGHSISLPHHVQAIRNWAPPQHYQGLPSHTIPGKPNCVAVCDATKMSNPGDEHGHLNLSAAPYIPRNASASMGTQTSKSPFLSLLQNKTVTEEGHQTNSGNIPCYIRQTSHPPRSLPQNISHKPGLSVEATRNFSTSPTLPALKKAKTDSAEKDLHSVDEYLVPHLDPVQRDENTFDMHDARLLPRQWEYTEYGRAHSLRPKKGVEFTVLSYNVLSQSLLEDNPFLYPHCPPETLDWSYRKTKLLEEMMSYKPTVLCLQEVESDHYTDFFLPELEARGYEGSFQKRTGSKPDGCAIFVRSDKFKISKTVPIRYCKGGLLDRDNVALVTKLKSVDSNGSVEKRDADVCIATTHLLFNPRRGDVKLAQLSVLFAELDKIAACDTGMKGSTSDNQRACTSYVPIIICGDFNMEPQSDIYKFVVQGYIHYEGLLCRLLSGQREQRHGRDIHLPNQLLPAGLGITDQCQYVDTLRDRKVPVPEHIGKACEPCEQWSTDSNSSSGPPSHGYGWPSARLGHHHAPLVSQGTGYLWHKLNFVSVYKHTIERLGHSQADVTTQHHYASCTVDYIFYNVRKKTTHTKRNKIVTRDVEEDSLRLLGRYGLLSSGELRQVGGLPNRTLGSDHLGLLAKFLLKS